MNMTTTEIQSIMQAFYQKNQRLPNTLLMPAAAAFATIEGISRGGMSTIHIESLFCMKVVYAAVPEPTACIL